jgi:hypothetical protein
MKASIPFQKIDFLTVKQTYGASVVLPYNISEKQRVKRLWIGHFWNNDVVPSTNAANPVLAGNAFGRHFVTDADGAGTLSTFKNKVTYFPALHRDMTLLSISFGG